MAGTTWPDYLVDQLRTLWTEGVLSASQIARRLGNGLSRNAVISKAHRAGIAEGRKAQPQQRTKRPKTERRPKTFAIFMQHAKSPPPPPPEPERDIDIPAPEFLGLTILQLEPDQCRYPHGGDDGTPYRFCGQPAVAKCSYCTYHMRLAYVGKPLERRVPYAYEPYVVRRK